MDSGTEHKQNPNSGEKNAGDMPNCSHDDEAWRSFVGMTRWLAGSRNACISGESA
jgi:hypothetical protein